MPSSYRQPKMVRLANRLWLFNSLIIINFLLWSPFNAVLAFNASYLLTSHA